MTDRNNPAPPAESAPPAELMRPLPSLDELDTKAFWLATKDNKLMYQRCDGCAKVVFHPRRHCTGCTNGKLSWHESSGQGIVYTFSIVRQSYHPFFRALAPYAVAWIDLDEGPRIMSNLVGVDPDQIAIGQRVSVEWEQHESLWVPLFRPS